MLTNYPNGVSSFGLPLIGSGPILTTGNVLFVNNSHPKASNGNLGTSPDKPLASIDHAVGRCSANNGDHIIAGPGHIEQVTAAGGLVFDVAGVTLIGLGFGSSRPRIDFSGSTAADVDIDAAGITIQNILFTSSINGVLNAIDVNAQDCSLLNCEYRDITGTSVRAIITDANADRLRIDGWRHKAGGSSQSNFIRIVGGDSISIQNFHLIGGFGVAAIENLTTATTNISIGANSFGNFVNNLNAADVVVTLHASATGVIDNILCRLLDNAANITEAFVGAAAVFGNNLYLVNAAGERAMQWNGTQTTDA